MHHLLGQEKISQIYLVDYISAEAFALSHLSEFTNSCICSRKSDLYYTYFTSEDGLTVIATTGNNIDT